MEGGPKILSGSRFQTHLKNAASALCARTLPKQRRSEVSVQNVARHHTYPRAAAPKRAAICRLEPIQGDQQQELREKHGDAESACNGGKKYGALAREVAHAWESRVGPPHEPAPAARVQTLFNDIELYPTKTQVFEMLVCARQCARRKSLTLTFGEFCVFAAELRKCSRQARQTSTKPESPIWSTEKEIRDKDGFCKNGSEASPPPCEVFLGGSCNPTTWRSDIAIPMLNKMGITYFNPQVEDWSTELMEVEYKAKAEARALLFVLDSETRAVAASVEAAHLAAAPRDLLLVLRPYSRHQMIGRETISDHEYVELARARATLQEAVERRGLPAFTDIPAALRCARAVLRGARTHPRQSLGHTILRLKRAFDAAGGRNARLQRSKAVDTIKEVTRTPREVADKSIPTNVETVDFETFCAAVAELAADPETRNGSESTRRVLTSLVERIRSACRYIWQHIAQYNLENHSRTSTPDLETVADAGAGSDSMPENRDGGNGRVVYNARLKAYGRKLSLFIPKNGGNRTEADITLSSDSEYVLTPGTSRRLERLPSMLTASQQVCLVGRAQPYSTRPQDILRRENLTYVIPRANDYSRMFSAPARRSAPQPESPHRDKKPRSTHELNPQDEEVQLRDKSGTVDVNDRLSASDFYTVSEDSTPLPFKGTYDEDLLLGSRMLVFCMSADAPCFATLVLAAHYMGLRPNATVLIVQQMDSKLVRGYSEAAIKDYNRGRHYLTDLAHRSEVPVFDNVEEAMAYVVKRLKPTS